MIVIRVIVLVKSPVASSRAANPTQALIGPSCERIEVCLISDCACINVYSIHVERGREVKQINAHHLWSRSPSSPYSNPVSPTPRKDTARKV